ncbi:MAG TPA: hypothetical protein VF183_08515 [Acidimicrobiales bacterium]
MAKGTSVELRKGEKVVAAEDLPQVPKGTPGRVTMVSGIRWIRYRVDFDNGVSLGSLDRQRLARFGEIPSRNGSEPG